MSACPKWYRIDIIHLTEVPTQPCDPPEARMWEDSSYFWVVLCKNHCFHARKNLFVGHRIPLAETDAFTSRPPVIRPFKVRCDECGKEYVYKPAEVLRLRGHYGYYGVQLEPPASFTPHPLLRAEAA